MDFESNPLLARQQGRAGAAETGIATEGCAACRATRAYYCCGAICVADSKVSVCARCRGCIVASAVGVSSPKAADSHRGKHYQSRDFVGECLGHTAGPLPEDRGRFDWLTMVYVRRTETRFDQHRDAALGVCYRSKRASEESQSYRKQFERGVRERVRAVGARSASPANSRRRGAVVAA